MGSRAGRGAANAQRGGSVAASNTRTATLLPKPRTSNGVRGRGGRRGETTGRRRPSSPSDMSPARAMRKAGRAGKYLPHREVTVLPAQPPQLLALGACQTVLATPFIAVRLTDSVAHLLRRALELASQLPGRATRPHQGDAHTIWRRYSAAQGERLSAIGTPPLHNGQGSTKTGQLHLVGAHVERYDVAARAARIAPRFREGPAGTAPPGAVAAVGWTSRSGTAPAPPPLPCRPRAPRPPTVHRP